MNFDEENDFVVDDDDDGDDDDEMLSRRIGGVGYRFMTNLGQEDVRLYQKTMEIYPEIPLILVDAPISIKCIERQGASLWVRSDYDQCMHSFWQTMQNIETETI